MENEHLRAAITRAGLALEEFADIVGVDVKTVQRWLSGRTPYPRHRAAVAGALDTTEHALWPDAVPLPTASAEREQPMPALSDVVAGYGRATDGDAPDPVDVLRSAAERIELIVPSVSPGVAELLIAKAAAGCHVRAIIEVADGEVEPVLGVEGLQVHASPGGEHRDLCRGDEQMLLALWRIGAEGEPPPVILVQRRTSGGLFDRLAEEFEKRWKQTTPLPTRERLQAYVAEVELDRRVEQNPEPEPGPPSPSPAVTSTGSGPNAPRRWPGRCP